MIALKTVLNGRQLSIAGAEDLCVLNSIVNAVGKLGGQSKPQRSPEEPPSLFLSVGGLTARVDSDDEHLRWTEQEPLSVGDEILITILEVTEADLPTSRSDAKRVIEDHQRQCFEDAKKTYFALREKFETDVDPEDNN